MAAHKKRPSRAWHIILANHTDSWACLEWNIYSPDVDQSAALHPANEQIPMLKTSCSVREPTTTNYVQSVPHLGVPW